MHCSFYIETPGMGRRELFSKTSAVRDVLMIVIKET